MKKLFSLILAVLIIVGCFINMPTAKATDATKLFSVSTDGYSCNGLITYTVSLKQGASLSGASIRFKYDSSVLEVLECDPYMTEDSYGDPIENISGIYESGKITGLSDVYGIIFMYGGENDYIAKSSDKGFVQITFKLKDNVLLPFSETTVDFYCYEFISYDNPQLNIFKGKEKNIATLKNLPKEHTFSENVCSSCGCLCFEYSKNENGVTVTKYNGRRGNFEIPSFIDDLSVTEIGNGKAPICADFLEVRIPDSVTIIGANAFSGTQFYNNPNNWKNGALYIDNFLIDTNENLPLKYYINNSIIIADKAFDGFTGYILCERNSNALKYSIANGTDFILPTISFANSKTIVDFPNQYIFTSVLKCDNPKDLVSTPENIDLETDFSSPVDMFYGTGSIFTVYDNNDYMGDYTLIAQGDLNGDGVCDVLDVALASLYSCESRTPSTQEIYAANGEIADEIDTTDYQSIVNIALQ